MLVWLLIMLSIRGPESGWFNTLKECGVTFSVDVQSSSVTWSIHSSLIHNDVHIFCLRYMYLPQINEFLC